MKKIVVFGSFMTDLTGWGERLPQPGETISGNHFQTGPGGKGSNQAVAAYRANGDVTMIAKLGQDVFAEYARNFYSQEGMDTSYLLTQPGGQTGTALIMVDQHSAQNMIMVLPGSNHFIDDQDLQKAYPQIEQADYLLVQNEINRDALEKVISFACEKGVKVILNPAPAREITQTLYPRLYCITPNESETYTLSGILVDSEESAQKAAKWFLKKGVQNVVITMGSAGSFVTNGNKMMMLHPPAVEAVDTTGAGDAFNGVLVTMLAEGKELFEAAKYANIAGALSVTRRGAAPSMPYRWEIDAAANR